MLNDGDFEKTYVSSDGREMKTAVEDMFYLHKGSAYYVKTKLAAVRIDREIGGTNAQITDYEPLEPPSKTCDAKQPENPTQTVFEPYKPKIRKSGTGCVTMINDHLYEGRFTPRVNGKRISKNVYAKTRE